MRDLIRQFFCHSKYDYRNLWAEFSKISTASLDIRDLLPAIGALIADAMSVRQVAFWLRSPASASFQFAYSVKAGPVNKPASVLRVIKPVQQDSHPTLQIPLETDSTDVSTFPISDLQPLHELKIQRVALLENRQELLGLLGIGERRRGLHWSAEDDQFLISVSSQVSQLILTHELSEELLIAREWDSFNRCASFILHDLKNLATVQSMTLENAKQAPHNPKFVANAFATFNHTTEKMIDLIASLSVRRGQFSFRQQPVNILEIIRDAFDDLKIDQRNGIRLLTEFPPNDCVRAVRGDPELLRKAFTNLILNAIQSMPKGEGALEVTVSQEKRDKITTSIRDTGCGIPPERLQTLFRPFQTSKQKGLGIGLCHTRSIIEVHGGQIRIESQVNAGTKVEIDFPTR